MAMRRIRDSKWYREFRLNRFFREIMHLRGVIRDPAYREATKEGRAAFKEFYSKFGGSGASARLFPQGKRKTALIVRNISLPYAKIEVLIEKALQFAGYECIPVAQRGHEYLRYDWLIGNRAGYLFRDFDGDGDPEWVRQQMPRLKTTRDWLLLRYRNVRVGQFVLASALRAHRTGQLNFEDPALQADLSHALNKSVVCVIGGTRLLDELKPDLLLFMDRAYTGWGELFDLALQRGLDAITWNCAYKGNRLNLKRYNSENERDHPLCPSIASWNDVRSMPWSRAYGEAVRQELFGAYKSGDWFGNVGTQFNKKFLSQSAIRKELGLTGDKKVAVIFPHILWDGSFFYGEDLFQDYTEWLVETIKGACANDKVQWVVKLHPAHVVKAEQEGRHGKAAELAVVESIVDKLPPHITLIPPESSVSTYSLFEIADYVVTVRGTVGIEAALLGIPVITAGTGRYDRRGFTIDSTSQDEYRSRLAALQTYNRLTEEQIELAERYAYYVFLCRPLRLSCASLNYARDGKATPVVTVHCQSPDEWRSSPDIRALAEWFQDGKTEDFLGAPLTAAIPQEQALAPGNDLRSSRENQPDRQMAAG